MGATGKISIVVAIYNVEPYLRQCLDTLVNQTYTDLEIICVDDGSADGSEKICDEYAARDGRVHVIHQENRGEPTARNAGLDAVTGRWVYMADGDDWLELNMLQTLMDLLDPQNGVDIAQCSYSFDYSDRSVSADNHSAPPEAPVPMRDFLYYIYHRDEYRGVASYLWSKIFPAAYFNGEKAKIRFMTEISVSYDLPVAAQCYLLANKTCYTSKPLYHYRQHGNSAMHSMQRRLATLGSCVAYEKMIELYSSAKIDEKTLDYIKRFYVYHAGVLLEYALKIQDWDTAQILREKARPYLDAYRQTNAGHPERYEWISALMIGKT